MRPDFSEIDYRPAVVQGTEHESAKWLTPENISRQDLLHKGGSSRP